MAISGRLNGAQIHIREAIPIVLYVQCATHTLKLALSDSRDLPSIRNCMGTVASVYNFFSTSPVRNIWSERVRQKCGLIGQPSSADMLKRNMRPTIFRSALVKVRLTGHFPSTVRRRCVWPHITRHSFVGYPHAYRLSECLG